MADGAGEKVKVVLSGIVGIVVILGLITFVYWITGRDTILTHLFAPSTTGVTENDPAPVDGIEPEPVIAPPVPESDRWTCFWDPTMNENWHDDVLCTRGSQMDRPILLPDWEFVTEADIMQEAEAYEDWLNQ